MINRKRREDVPLVSVVIPTYNRAQYIAETIESVLRQTYENIEILVIDDGSTDDTAAVVRQFGSRVRYVWQKNAERGAARNHGLRLASGEFISFLDSDDLWMPRKVEAGVDFLSSNRNVGLLYGDALVINAEGSATRIIRARGPSGRVTGKLLEENFVIMPTNLARTSLLREIGGFCEDREISGSEDWEAWLRLSLITDFAYAPEVTAKYRIHATNTVNDALGMRRSMCGAVESFCASEDLTSGYQKYLRRARAKIALTNAINYCSINELSQSMKFLRDAASAHPPIILDPRYGYTIARLLKNFVTRK